MVSEIICGNCSVSNQPGETFCKACGWELSQVSGLLNQRYRVLTVLGEGGFGKVYKVEDGQLNNRLLAAKKLDFDKIHLRDRQDAIAGFKQEAIILSDLRHPNLPRIYEYFIENQNYYLIMDFIEGETLGEYVEALPSPLLPAEKVVKIGVQLASVLDYLHTRRPAIIFRDLKPENIMITVKEEVYLIDFGIARHFKPGQTRDTIRMGTPGYASPEQVAGRQTSVSSDIYSLGAVLHQVLSGDAPTYLPQFVPLELVGSGEARLGRLVMRMLERDAQARPASMAEIKEELEQIARILQSKSAAPGKRPLQSDQKPAAFQPPLSGARGDLLYTYRQHSAAIKALAWSPDGDFLASAGEDRQVQVWQAPTGRPVFTYQGHTRAVNSLAWSPDSQYLASAGNDYSIQVWLADTGQSMACYQEHKHWVQALSWSSDGMVITSGDAAHQVHLWESGSGQQRRIYRGHKRAILALAFSPDARLVASADEGGEVHIWESASGQLLIAYTGHQKAVGSLSWSPDGKSLVSGSWDRSLHIWEVAGGKQIAIYTEHERMVNAVAWSPVNKVIASAGKDQVVQIWNVSTCQTLFTYRGHTASISALSWSPGGSYLASAGSDTAVHVWRAH